MPDSRMKGRVKGLLGSQQPEEQPYEDMAPPAAMPDPHAQRQALQVLTLAQKTADEHIATAQRQADGIRASAQAAAEQVGRDAHTHAEDMRRQASNTVAEAQKRAEQIVRDAQAAANDLERDAQRQYDEVVGTLETKRSALAQQIEGLQQFDREYRARLRTFMNSQLQALGPEEPVPASAPVQRAPHTAPPEMVRVPDDGS